jgi:hypothetical protein
VPGAASATGRRSPGLELTVALRARRHARVGLRARRHSRVC